MTSHHWRLVTIFVVALTLIAAPGQTASRSPHGSATPAGTPGIIAEVTRDCPFTRASEIPGAADSFVEFGLGGPDVWLAGWGNAPASSGDGDIL